MIFFNSLKVSKQETRAFFFFPRFALFITKETFDRKTDQSVGDQDMGHVWESYRLCEILMVQNPLEELQPPL